MVRVKFAKIRCNCEYFEYTYRLRKYIYQLRNWLQYRIHSLHYSFCYILESASKHNMDLSFYIRHILLGLRSSFKGFLIDGASEVARKFEDTPFVDKMVMVTNRLLATASDTFVRGFLTNFCRQQLCLQLPDIVIIICHRLLSPKNLSF